jgi:AraC-like DNA-binding protein
MQAGKQEATVKENAYTCTFNTSRFFAYLFFSLLGYTSCRLAVSKG